MYQGHTLTLSAFFLLAAFPAHAAVTCPSMPEAVTSVNRDITAEIRGSAGSLGKIKAGEVAAKTEIEAKNLFGKYPNVDKLLALQTLLSTYCGLLTGTTTLSEVEKMDRWEKFSVKVLSMQSSPEVLTSRPASTPSTTVTDRGPKSADESRVTKPSPAKISLVGSWAGSAACPVLFFVDDGKNVEGSCDTPGHSHKLSGTYEDAQNISIVITRTDPAGCVTNARGFIKIVSRNSVEIGQNGWNGCGVTTGSVTTLLSRQ